MPNRFFATLFACLLFGFAPSPSATAEDFIPRAQDKPPGPALSPADAMAKMKLPEGFKVELVAAEPDVINPTSMTFDERGRIWITESVEYPRHEIAKGRDRIKILEDTNHDGKFDKVTVFKEGLNIPCGIVLGNGGVYVTNSPDILFLKDTDGDDKADTEEVVLTGFGRDDTHELPNSLTWGPDGWLYGMNGVFNQAHVKDPASGKMIDFTCAIWRYHPKTKRFELFSEGTSNPWGLDYNRQGDWFLSCCVIDHLFHMTQSGYYQRQGGPYPPLTVPLPSIATQHHQKAAYAGLVMYDADVYPEAFRGKLLMGNLHGSCINQDHLSRNGATYKQANDDDFLSANDAWFMPVAQRMGPDGCVYIMDWYDRYHCYQDANRDSPGLDRSKGRIYRISYKDTPLAKPFDLGKASNVELLKTLGNSNVWWRRMAQHLLNDRFDPTLVEPLKTMALDESDTTQAHMHALWLLVSQNAIDEAFHLKLLSSKDPAVRNWGVRAAGQLGEVSAPVFERMKVLAASDESADVRVQIPVAAGRLSNPDPMPLFQAMLQNPENGKDPIIPNILYNNLRGSVEKHADEILKLIGTDAVKQSFGATTGRWITNWINAGPGRNPAVIVDRLRSVLKGNPGPDEARAALQSVLDAFAVTGTSVDQRAPFFNQEIRNSISALAERPSSAQIDALQIRLWWLDQKAVDDARKMVADPNVAAADRATLLKGLSESRAYGNAQAFLSLSVDDNAPVLIRQLAAGALADTGDKHQISLLLQKYGSMPPDLRPMTINAMTRNGGAATALLDAVAAKGIPATDVTSAHVRQMAALGLRDVDAQLQSTWGKVKTQRDPERVKIVDQYRQMIKSHPPGNPAAGWAVFTAKCSQCHTIYGKGGAIGPDLTGVGRQDVDSILTNVIDPNLVIGNPYFVHVVRKKNGTAFSGLLIEESDKSVTLKDQNKIEFIPKDQIDRHVVQEISMMPEGLEKTMTEPEFCDLVAFLLTKEPPAGGPPPTAPAALR